MTGRLYGSLTCWLEELWLSGRVCVWASVGRQFHVQQAVSIYSRQPSAHGCQPPLSPQPVGVLGWIRLPAAHPAAPAALPHWLTVTIKTRYSAAHSHIDQHQWNQHSNGRGYGNVPLASAATLSVSEAVWSHGVCFNHQSLIDHLLKSYAQRAPLTFCPVWFP